jgi:hypothetical protein
MRRDRRPFAGRAFAVAAIAFSVCVLFAAPMQAHVTVFGPKTYTLAQQKDVTETIALTSPCDVAPAAIYTLVVTNGDSAGNRRLSSGTLTLNGTTVVAPSDFSQQQSTIEKTIVVQRSNTLRIQLSGGKPDAMIGVSIRRHIDLIAPVFAEKIYTTTAKSDTFRDTFTAAAAAGTVTIRVRNGKSDGTLPAKSVSVSLNGKEVVTKQELNGARFVEKSVTVVAANALVVSTTSSGAGSVVSVSVVRHLIDTTGPVITTGVTNGPFTATTPFVLNGTVADPSGVAELTVNGVPVTVAANNTFVAAVPFVPGTNSIAIAARDCEGNVTQQTLSVVLDQAAPVVTVTSPPPGATLTGRNVTLIGSATDALSGVASVTCNGTVATLNGTTFQCVLTLADGPNDVAVAALDRAGNRADVTVRYTVGGSDGAPPVVTIDSPVAGAILASALVTVSGTATDDEAVAGVTLNGQPATLSGANWTAARTLDEGTQTLIAVATDTSGRTGAATVAVTVDLTAPTITATAAPSANGAGWSRAGTVVTFTCADAVSGIATCTAPVTISADGEQTIEGTAVDKAGHTAIATITLKADATAPLLAVEMPVEQAAVYATSAFLAGSVSDSLSGIATVTCNGENAAVVDGTFQCLATITAGDPRVHVTVTDLAGNTTTVTRTLVYTEDRTDPLIVAVPLSAINATWTHAPFSVNFQCADQESGIATCPEPVTIATEGANQVVSGTAVDKAGNQATASLTVSIDDTAPQLQLAAAPTGPVATPAHQVSGSVSDGASGVQSVTCNGVLAELAGAAFTCSVPLPGGTTAISVIAIDIAGNEATALLQVTRDAQAPLIEIEMPAAAAITNAEAIVVAGTASDDDAIASIEVNGVAATLDGETFTATVPLGEGTNTLTAIATDRAGNTASASATAERIVVPSITIDSPVDLATVNTSTVLVTGSVAGAATVDVNEIAAIVSGGTYSAEVPLAQGRTVITARATSVSGRITAASVNLYRDSIPPRVVVYEPARDVSILEPSVTVSGMVDDIVVGTVNAGQVQLTVGGVPAVVSNRGFIAANIPLVSGNNDLLIEATDQAGNVSTQTYSVYYDDFGYSKLLAASGNLQTAVAGATLPQPLVVSLTDRNGVPIAGKSVRFAVVANNGSIAGGTQSGRSLELTTNAQGLASVQWTLGSRAGAGNNRVEAHAEGFYGTVTFVATATTAAPHKVFVDLGDLQFGAVGAPLPRPLTAVVLDAGGNRIGGVPATFTVADGGGSFDGQPSVTVITDSDGRASARPTLGPEPGQDNNVFTVTAEGISYDATFAASGRVAGDPANTRIRGVVLDNTDTPVPGVSLRIDGTTLVTQSDANGQFVLSGVPVGYVKLFADGSTSPRPGSWPMLEFFLYTIAGQDNEIGMPVYLLPIDVARGLHVDDVNGGTLTIPELPGFSLTVAGGTATFPGGGRTGTVSATLVHADKMPMLPSAGQQPRFIVTIQPPGVHFDPPAPISFPNVDGLAPGQIGEMFSFDHDLGQFVSIGTGTVSADGSTVRSDPGVGIIKGGWHGVSVPPTTGAAANCSFCQQRVGSTCAPHPAREGRACADDGDLSTEDICRTGTCVHPPITIRIGGITSTTRNIYVDRDDPSRTLNDAVALPAGQAVYSNETAGDLVAWRAHIDNVSMRTRVTQYIWTAEGPETHTGPSASEWMVGTMRWKPGVYTIRLKVRFNTGFVKETTYEQKVGIRTNDYIIFGVIRESLPEPTAGVDLPTRILWSCPASPGSLLPTAIFGGSVWNIPIIGIPEDWPIRHYVNYRLVNSTYNDAYAGPTDLNVPYKDPILDYPRAFGVDSVNGYRQAIHVQFKYIVEDGKIVGTPQPVGQVYSKSGYTPAPCSDPGNVGLSIVGFPGQPGPRNQALDLYPDRTGFTYLMQIRAGGDAVSGYRALNRRDLPYVYFRARFAATEGTLKTNIALGSDTHPDEPQGNKDYSSMPTFFAYQRLWAGSEYGVISLPGYPLHQDLEKFLVNSPKLPGGGPYYPP